MLAGLVEEFRISRNRNPEPGFFEIFGEALEVGA